MDILKGLIDRLKGKKRHAGAIVIAAYILIVQLGIEIPPEVEKWLPIIGEILLGAGWLDKFRRMALHQN